MVFFELPITYQIKNRPLYSDEQCEIKREGRCFSSNPMLIE